MEAINIILENRDEILETVAEAIRVAFDNGKSGLDMAALRQRRTDLRLLLDNLIEQVMKDGKESEEMDRQLKSSMEELERLEEAIQQQDLEQRAAECENARLKQILQRIQETPCALTEYDDRLVRQIVERVTVDSKDHLTVSFGQGVDIQVQIP